MNSKICFALNSLSHYRKGIYNKINAQFSPDYFYTKNFPAKIKKIELNNDYQVIGEGKYQKLFFKFYWTSGLIRLHNNNYEHVVFNSEIYCLSTWIFLIVNKFKKTKTSLWTHGLYGSESGLKKFFKLIFFNLFDNLLLYGNISQNLLIKNGFDSSKLNIIYNSLDYGAHIEIRKKVKKTSIFKDHFGNSNKTILYIGRIQKLKRIDILIKAIFYLKSKGIDLNLVLVGPNLNEININNLVTDLNLKKNVWFYGECYNENTNAEIIFNSMVCVSPGNIGLTAIHSLTFGTPIITHNIFSKQMPEHEVIIEYETGSYFKINDVESLSEEVIKWIEIKKNDCNNDISKFCYNMIDDKYNPNFQIKILEKIFQHEKN